MNENWLNRFRKTGNMRELGGYETKDGRHIKHSLFYRSGAPGTFDPEEMDALNHLHIKALIDFRSDAETKRLPDPEVKGARYYHISAITDEAGNEIDLSPEGMETISEEQFFSREYQSRFLLNFYGRMPFSPAYRLLFDVIRRNEVPVLFHCSAGKDRTGVGAALILLALNVDEKIVMEDYMKTNVYRRQYIDDLLDSKADLISKYPAAEEVFRGFEGVNASSLQCSLNEIKRRCGSYPAYFKEYLHMDADDLMDLRRKYTE